MPVEFEDNTIKVSEAMNDAIIAWLYEASGEMKSQIQRNTPVKTGQLKGSWDYHVDESKLESVVGSPLENAIWNEFGTGEYALEGNGRKTPWKYQDSKGNWYTTKGKRPRRSLFNAFQKQKNKLQKALEAKLKELGT